MSVKGFKHSTYYFGLLFALHVGSDLNRNEQRGPFIHPELGGVGGVPFAYMFLTPGDIHNQVKTVCFYL